MLGRIIDQALFAIGDTRWSRVAVIQALGLALVRWRAEWRTCPRCADDPLQVLAPRKRYFGRCPKCGALWG